MPIEFPFQVLTVVLGLALLASCLYVSFARKHVWFITIPMLVYLLHFLIFYGITFYADYKHTSISLLFHMPLTVISSTWSAILRAHSLITMAVYFFMLIVFYDKFAESIGVKKNG